VPPGPQNTRASFPGFPNHKSMRCSGWRLCAFSASMTLVGNDRVRMPFFDFGALNLALSLFPLSSANSTVTAPWGIEDEDGIRFYAKNGFCGSGQAGCGLSLRDDGLAANPGRVIRNLNSVNCGGNTTACIGALCYQKGGFTGDHL